MYHVNPTTGKPNVCKASSQACPYGGEDKHYETFEQAEVAFSKTMPEAFATFTRSPSAGYEQATEALREAIKADKDVAEARKEFIEAGINYASTGEGQAHLQGLVDQMEASSTAFALYQHMIAEGNKRRVQEMADEDFAAVLDTSKPSKIVSKVSLESGIDWASLPSDANIYGYDSTAVSDAVKYQAAADKFLANEAEASTQMLAASLPAVSVYRSLRYSMPPRTRDGEYTHDTKEWPEISKRAEAYGETLAKKLLNHPNANAKIFARIGTIHDPSFVIGHERCPLEVKEEFLAKAVMNEDYMNPDDLPHYRQARLASNRIALYLAAIDDDSYERQEAFNQVIIAGMETFSEDDRMWLANNLGKMPTSPNTLNTIKHSLASWAKGQADEEERTALLALVEPPQEEKGFFRRRR